MLDGVNRNLLRMNEILTVYSNLNSPHVWRRDVVRGDAVVRAGHVFGDSSHFHIFTLGNDSVTCINTHEVKTIIDIHKFI